jgi:hypothetical protein
MKDFTCLYPRIKANIPFRNRNKIQCKTNICFVVEWAICTRHGGNLSLAQSPSLSQQSGFVVPSFAVLHHIIIRSFFFSVFFLTCIFFTYFFFLLVFLTFFHLCRNLCFLPWRDTIYERWRKISLFLGVPYESTCLEEHSLFSSPCYLLCSFWSPWRIEVPLTCLINSTYSLSKRVRASFQY